MGMRKPRIGWTLACVVSLGWLADRLPAQEATEKAVTEPVFRVSKAVDGAGAQRANEETVRPKQAVPPNGVKVAELVKPANSATPVAAVPARTPHPLDAAIDIAHNGLDNMQKNIRDYTATLVKRETINGKVGDQETIEIKIRNPRQSGNQSVPFSIYMKFKKPTSGREVLWVEGQRKNNLLVHEPGVLTGFKTLELEPTGWIAMRGNLHPIYEAGLENLVKKLIEKAERDRAAGLCEVVYSKGATINGRKCTLIEVKHAEKRAPYEFHKAQVFVDDELQIPIRYASYDWPASPQDEPRLIEEYTYIKVKLNVGLTDRDFDPSNEDYDFPGY